MVAERLDDFAVGEFEQAVAFFNERDAHAENGEHAGVFDADDAAADHDERAGQFGQVEDLVAVDDGAAVDGHLGRGGGLGADGDDDVVGFERGFSLRACDAHLVGIDEAGDAVDHVDAVARELGLGDVDFGLDDGLDAEGQVGHGDLFLDPVVDAVDGAVVVAGEVQHGLAHGLGGDGAGVDADAADDGAGLDDGHALVHLGGGHGGALAGGPGTNDDQVILDAHAGVSPRVRGRFGRSGLIAGMRRWLLIGGYHSGGEWTLRLGRGCREEKSAAGVGIRQREEGEYRREPRQWNGNQSPGPLIWESAWT